MFKALRARKAKSIVLQVSSGIEAGIAGMSAIERAATMAICNAMLKATGDHYGREAERAPQSLSRDRAAALILDLAASHASILRDVLLPLSNRNSDDVILSHAIRQVRALELMIITVGCSLVPHSAQLCRQSWRTLWSARNHAEIAADLLIGFHRHAGSRPLPKYGNGKVSRSELIELARMVPAFLRATPAPGSKPASVRAKATA